MNSLKYYGFSLGTVLFLMGCNGGGGSSETPSESETKPNLKVETSLRLNSGEFSRVSWENLSNTDVQASIEQVSGENVNNLLLTTSDFSFTAPDTFSNDLELKFKLIIENKEGQTSEENITIDVTNSDAIFSEGKTIYELEKANESSERILSINDLAGYLTVNISVEGNLEKRVLHREGYKPLSDVSGLEFMEGNINPTFKSADWNGDGKMDLISYMSSSSFDKGIYFHEANDNGFKEPVVLYSIHPLASPIYPIDFMDINQDGYTDIKLLSDEISSSYWLLFDPTINEYSPEYLNNYSGAALFVDINKDESLDKVRLNFNGSENVFSTSYLEVSKQTSEGVFDEWEALEELRYFSLITDFDVNLDGSMDLLTSYVTESELAEGYTGESHSKWYAASAEGEIEGYTLPILPKYRNNFFNTLESPYFIDIDTDKNVLTKYKYDGVSKQPVPGKTFYVPENIDMNNVMFFDLDSDGDLDLITYDEFSVKYYENLTK